MEDTVDDIEITGITTKIIKKTQDIDFAYSLCQRAGKKKAALVSYVYSPRFGKDHGKCVQCIHFCLWF